MTARPALVAAVAAAEQHLAMARALVAGWRSVGMPVGESPVTRAEAAVAAAREALAQHDRAD